MTHRRIYRIESIDAAAAAIAAVRESGITDEGISLVARADIELASIPDELKLADTDFLPAAARGAGYGAVAGTLGGLVAMVFPPLGLTLAGALIGGAAGGAMVGSWASALVGSSIPEPLRREYESEIEAGRILMVIDASDEQLAEIGPRLAALDIAPMAHEHASE